MQKYYLKKTFYAYYVKNVLLPLEKIKSFGGNKEGIKNIGNTRKLNNNNVRTKTNLIQKAYHNFFNSNILSFVTLTYEKNFKDIRTAKKHFNLFMKKFKKWWSDEKRAKFMGSLKYFYVYEYQKRGAVHFHIIFNRKMYNQWILNFWKYGITDTKRVAKGTNEFVVKYLSKYLSKTQGDEKSKNQEDIGVQAYSFSRNCEKVRVEVGIIESNPNELVNLTLGQRVFYFKTKIEDSNSTILSGIAVDSLKNQDMFKNFKKYTSLKSMRFINWLNNFSSWFKTKNKKCYPKYCTVDCMIIAKHLKVVSTCHKGFNCCSCKGGG